MANWVCNTGRAVPNEAGATPAYICVDDEGNRLDEDAYIATDDSGTEVDGNKDIRPDPTVPFGGARELGVTDTFDRTDRTVVTSVDFAENLPNRIRAEEGGTGGRRYQELEDGLRGYFGQSFESYSSLDAAWNRVVEDAMAGNREALRLLEIGQIRNSLDPGDDGVGGGGVPAGPRYTINEASEEDIYTLAQGLAQEMLGRPITDKQFDNLLKRVRKEENANPTVTRTMGNTTKTEVGVTNEDRKSVMAELLQENPRWRNYQMSQGVLDALTRSIQTGKRLDSGV